MALIEMNFYSAVLTTAASAMYVIPQEAAPKDSYPVVWLLPPAGMDHKAWQRHTRIEAIAERYGFIAAMPLLQLSYGMDMVHGMKYYTMLTKELPALTATYFSVDLSKQLIVGTEETVYAAMKATIENQGMYTAALGLSAGSLTDETWSSEKARELSHVFGCDNMSALQGTDKDLNVLAADSQADLTLVYGLQDQYAASAKKLGDTLMTAANGCVRVFDKQMSWEDWEAAVETFVAEHLQA